MKFKPRSFVLSLAFALLGAGVVQAASVPSYITGTGEINSGLGQVYFDYYDAYPATPPPPTKDPSIVARIGNILDTGTPCDAKSCKLQGFLWSEAVGWIALDGDVIKSDMTTPCAVPSSPQPGEYCPNHYARARFGTTNPNTDGNLTGYVWSDAAGWIALSFDSASTAPDPVGFNHIAGAQQTASQWGVWVDLTSIPSANDPGSGKPIRDMHGFAWSENLGWISFEGAKTTWFPDTTPPEFNAVNGAWFKNQSDAGNKNITSIKWDNIAYDPESGIMPHDSADDGKPLSQVTSTTLFIAYDPATNGGCHATNLGTIAINAGSSLSVTMTGAGNVKGSTSGFCKFDLYGKIFNGAGISFTIKQTLSDATPPADTLNLSNPRPTYSDPIAFNVRAGDVDLTDSTITPSDSPGGVIADGQTAHKFSVVLKDYADNPIISVTQNCDKTHPTAKCRNVILTADFANQLRYVTTNSGISKTAWTDPCPGPISTCPYPTLCPGSNCPEPTCTGANTGLYAGGSDSSPVIINADSGGPYFLNCFGDALREPTFENIGAQLYAMDVKSYAPTMGSYNAFSTNKFTAHTQNSAMDPTNGTWTWNATPPGIFTVNGTTTQPYPPTTANPATETGDLTTGLVDTVTGLPKPVAFDPPVTTAGNVVTGSVNNQMVVGTQATLTDTFSNASALPMSNIDIDTIFDYRDGGSGGASYMETQGINDAAGDAPLGWSDPVTTTTRYEIFKGYLPATTTPMDATNSRFVNKYSFYSYSGTPATINGLTGVYNINGIWGIPQDYSPTQCADDKDHNCYTNSGSIDRSDLISDLSGTGSRTITFTPQKIVNVTGGIGNDTTLKISQDVAYLYDPGPLKPLAYTIFSKVLAPSVSLRDIGAQFSGLGTGKTILQNVGTRKFDTVGSAATTGLSDQISRNVASLTTGASVTPCSVVNQSVADFNALTGLTCVIPSPDANNPVVWFRADNATDVMTLGSGATLTVPNDKHITIIVQNGGNLFINSNIKYGNTNSSLGIILMENRSAAGDHGGNLYIGPNPTNLVGFLYADGSVMSRASALGSFYFGTTTPAPATALKNQLLWQGSIASRNTIGGSSAGTVPNGKSCAAGITQVSCAQLYDMDFIRRFVAMPTADTTKGLTTDDSVLFSGGGSCNTAANTCALGTLGLDTVVSLSGGLLDMSKPDLLSTFYIQPVTRPTPPGFSQTEEQQTLQQVR